MKASRSPRPAHGVHFRLSASLQFARASTLLRGGRERSSASLGLSRSTLHAACAIDKLRRREAASSARWAAYCAIVRARSSTLDGGAPERWRRSNGPGPSTNQSVLFRHLTNANSHAWQHSLRSRSCRYQIGRGCCTSRQNSGSTDRTTVYPFHAWKNARHLVVVDDFQAELHVGKHYVGRASCDEVEDFTLLPSRLDGAFCDLSFD